MARLDRKLIQREKETREKAARLAAMTPEERAQHEAWQKSHKPGKAAAREAARAKRRHAKWLREMLTKAGQKEPEEDIFA